MIKPLHERLSVLMQKNRVASAYLLVGSNIDLLKKEVILCAQQLNCIQTNRCGECLSCKKIERATHPDIHWIDPQGESIKVDDVRELQKKLRFKPLEGRYQLILLMRAENLLMAAANALLKILEEPPSQTIFILTTPYMDQLLPTILSRCQLIRFPSEPPPLPTLPFQQELLSLPKTKEALFELAEKMAETDELFHAALEILIHKYYLVIKRMDPRLHGETGVDPHIRGGTYEHFTAILETKKNLKYQINRELLASELLIRLTSAL